MSEINPGLEAVTEAKERHLNISAICRKAGMARSTPLRWENGVWPRSRDLQKFRAAMEAIASGSEPQADTKA